MTLLLLISLAANAYQYLNPKETTIIKQEMPKEEVEKIHEISRACGIDAVTLEHASVLSTLSDIKTTLFNNTTLCNAGVISAEETEILDVFLTNEPDILSKIKAQNAFVSPYSMKRIVILPVKE